MAEQVVLKREWKEIDLDPGEVTIGESTYEREWCVDIDNSENNRLVYVRVYDGEGSFLGQKEVPEGAFRRICQKGFQLRLLGNGTAKYALPWVLFDVKK